MTLETVASGTCSFIPQLQRHPGIGPDSALVTGTYDLARFDPSLFDAYGISKPSTIDQMVTKRRAEFLAGRIFARLAADELDIPAFDLPIGPDRAPLWPAGVAGAISHSHGRCGCLLTRRSAQLCGLDMERVAEGVTLEALVQKCLRAPERDWVAGQGASHPAAATLLFSAKETIFKAFSSVVGGYFGFECAEFVNREDTNGLRFRLTETLHPTLPKGHKMTVRYALSSEFVMTWMLYEDP